MKTQIELGEIINLSDKYPNTKIWCLSVTREVDFVTTAKDIRDTVGNFDWNGITFYIVTNGDKELEEELEKQKDIVDKVIEEQEIREIKEKEQIEKLKEKEEIKYSKRVKVKTAFNKELIENVINKEIEELEEKEYIVQNIQLQTIQYIGKRENTIQYTALIEYLIKK